jgi:DNA-binding CsgD family transcriptional regulator
MLLGRDQEIGRIQEALEEARRGRGSALLILGEPGIGKTELLRTAVGSVADMNVLSARGVQFEMDVPYAGLHELLRPAFTMVGRLPDAQSNALRSSLGLGERIEADRLVIGASTLGLLSAYAEEKPLLVVVDDAHWLDRASGDALAFVARRLGSDPVAMLVALRDGEDSPFLVAGLPELTLHGLDQEPASMLLNRAAKAAVPGEVASWVLAATAGNPLALMELGPEAARLRAPAADAPLPIATSVERAYLRRAEPLSSDARRALLLVAASGAADRRHATAAAAWLGISPAAVDEAAGALGLVVRRDDELDFAHPLARAAIYHAASPADRREAHRALAEVMRGREEEDRRAWHAAAASSGPDATAADAMERAAARARERSAYAAAGAAYEEAARLTKDKELRAARLTNGAQCAWLGGRAEHAIELLKQSAELATGEDLNVTIQGLLGHITLRQGRVDEAQRMLVIAATAIEGRDRLQAIRLLADATVSSFGFGHPEKRLETARLALELCRPDDPAAIRALAHVGYGTTAVMSALGADGPLHLRESVSLFAAVAAEDMDVLVLTAAGLAGLFLREAQAGRDLLERTLTLARERAPTGALPVLLFLMGRDAAATDRWDLARAFYEEGARVAAETTQSIWHANILAGLAWLDAYEGREPEAREHAASALRMAQSQEMGFVKAWCLTALGQLELGLGHHETALKHLLECSAAMADAGIGDPDLMPAPDLVDAYVRLGRLDEAQQVLDQFLPIAAAKGQPFALARAARAQGLLAPEGEMAARFEMALRFHSETPDLFERARTELFYGERLRRGRRRVESRKRLRSALGAFERLGAAPWADRALAELHASGETARPRNDGHRLTLTPQELQVAIAIAEGRTTREAAAKLYLSPKTIEYHLRSIYGKLDIRSREQLATALGIR